MTENSEYDQKSLRLVKGKTDLKKIEAHRLEQLILADLKIYQPCAIGDLHQRIGEEINKNKIKRQLDKMIEEGKIEGIGEKRWRNYRTLI